jgi:hypothetical protein
VTKKEEQGDTTYIEDPAYSSDVSCCSRLQTAEAVLLIGFRLSGRVQAIDSGLDSEHWARCGVANAEKPAQCLFQLFKVASETPLNLNLANSSPVTDDEKRLLCALSAQQNGRPIEAFDVLITRLPGTAARIAMEFSRALAAAFSSAGLFLPVRTWTLKELSFHRTLRAPANVCRSVRYSLH